MHLKEELEQVVFSCRRRHTRFDCDWSSDVCSSDLKVSGVVYGGEFPFYRASDHCNETKNRNQITHSALPINGPNRIVKATPKATYLAISVCRRVWSK